MTDGKKSHKELHREAYGKAMSRLRDAHPDEFNSLRMEEAKARDLDWKPKPTEEQKAREQLAKILAEYPGLAETIGAGPDEDSIMPPDVMT